MGELEGAHRSPHQVRNHILLLSGRAGDHGLALTSYDGPYRGQGR